MLETIPSCALQVRTLCELLQHRAATQPHATAYLFLTDGESEGVRLSYAELDLAARRVAATLLAHADVGARALLIFPHGPEYLDAFFGCLYAGIIAVPAYPPNPVRPERAMQRLQAMAASAAPALVLGPEGAIAALEHVVRDIPVWADVQFIDSTSWIKGASFEPGVMAPETPAFLQYTSGSTAAPKGVVVTHANLLTNSAQISAAFGHGPQTRIVSWLPLYHDMGLIGGLLQPLYLGTECVLMSPADFMQRPMRWLEAIARYRATTSGGPNFAYELCIRRSKPEQRAALDLSCWKVAFNGAEPIRASTLTRFSEAFAPANFSASAHYPCYGLAEATLLVTGSAAGQGAISMLCDTVQLERGEAVASLQEHARELVSCGKPWHQEIAIVDPVTGVALKEGCVGEILVCGSNVAAGYWGQTHESQQLFAARVKGKPGAYLRTGDLGFLASGELFVTGRQKDLIILRGRNVYPQDLEQSAESAHPAVHAGCVAAFAVNRQGEDGVVIVAEIERRFSGAEFGDVAAAVRRVIAHEHEAAVEDIVFLRPGRLPKTSSGKLQRAACRQSYLRGELDALWQAGMDGSPDEASPRRDEVVSKDLRLGFVHILASILRIDPEQFDAQMPLQDYGMDSLALLEFQARVEDMFGVSLPLNRLFGGANLADVLALLSEGGFAVAHSQRPIVANDVTLHAATFPLSPEQRAIWFEAIAAPGSDAYHVAAAFSLSGEISETVIAAAVDHLVARHDILRVALHVGDGEPRQQVRESVSAGLKMYDAMGWSSEQLQTRLHQLAKQPFAVESGTGSLFAVHLLRLQADRRVLLFVAHHLIVDLAAAAWLLSDLQEMLACRIDGRAPLLEPITHDWATHTASQGSPASALEADWQYWRTLLASPLPSFDPPLDRPRSIGRTLRGARLRFNLGTRRSKRIADFAQRRGITANAFVLSVYQLLLHRWCAQDDLLVAMPTVGRESLRPGAPLGHRIKPVLMRSSYVGGDRFEAFLQHTQHQLWEALQHRSLPFASLVERLSPERDSQRPSLAQAWFAWQRAPVRIDSRIPELLLGEGEGLVYGGIRWAPIALDHRDVPSELSLVMLEGAAGLSGVWEYAADLFDAVSIERLNERFAVLLDAALDDAACSVADLPLLSGAERALLLAHGRGPKLPPEFGTLPGRFFQRARSHPDLPALRESGREISYGQLASSVRKAAVVLRDAGVGPGDRVAVGMDRGSEFVIAVLAILTTGGVYVPLDPAYPAERLRYMLADAQPRLLIGTSGADGAIERSAAELDIANVPILQLDGGIDKPFDMPPQTTTDSAAYLLYTSGSSGLPKGTSCSHASVLNLLMDFDTRQPLAEGERCSWWTSISFDVSVYEIFSALLYGGTLCPVPDALRLDGPQLCRWLAQERIASAYMPPFLLDDLAAAVRLGKRHPLRRLLVGVEPIREQLLCEMRSALPGLVILNGYGPTEATICATVYEAPFEAKHQIAPIGSAPRNVELLVLDSRGELAPWGTAGELHIGGAGLAHGYWQRRALTAECFVPHRYAQQPGARVYRTGDIVRWWNDGTLGFLGRRDQQVKLRGHRVELGEIEAMLRELPQVRDVAVQAFGEGENRYLAAYYVLAEGGAGEPEDFIGLLREKLPAFMIPAHFLQVGALPLTPSGKLDRRALPIPHAALISGAAYVAPRGAIESTLAQHWAGLLGSPALSRNDNFFARGGHSLLAVRAMHDVNQTFGTALPVTVIFAAPTLAALAARIESHLTQTPVERVLPQRLDRSQWLPLSPQQRRLWLLQNLDPESTAYNVVWAASLQGELNRDALQSSLDALIARHESLRTSFHLFEGEARQRIHAPRSLPLTHEAIDLETLPARLTALACQPFDLTSPSILRAHLLRLSPQHHVLLLATHHVVFDGVHTTFLRDFGAFYAAHVAGAEPSLPQLDLQPVDLAHWQNALQTGPEFDRHLHYWREALAGEIAPLSLPTDRPRPPTPSLRGARHRFAWPTSLARKLQRYGREHGVTSFVTVLAAFQVLLSRLSGQETIHVGTPVVQSHLPMHDMVGCFVNTVVLRAELAGNPGFAKVVRDMQERTLGALLHQDLPFDVLVDAVERRRDPSRPPVFQVMFALLPDPWSELAWDTLKVSPIDVDAGGARFDLLLSVWEGDGRLTGSIEYATDLFDAPSVARLAQHLEILLDAALEAPETHILDLPLLSPAQRSLQLSRWNDTGVAAPAAQLLHQAFERQADLSPDVLAVVDEHDALSYCELECAANRLARTLESLGAAPGVDIAVLVPRNVQLVAALLGVVKSGAAYVPLESSLPAARMAQMLDALGVRHLITVGRCFERVRELRELVPGLTHVVCVDDIEACAAGMQIPGALLTTASIIAGQSPARMPTAARPADKAYTIFTSGSTGRPKGVVVQHAPAVNLCDWVNTTFDIGANDRLLFVTSPCFDLSVYDIFGALGAGATVRIASEEELREPEVLHRILCREAITFWNSAPAMLQQIEALFASPARHVAPAALRLVFLSGDWIPVQLPDAVRRAFPRALVVSLGGATEAAVWSNFHRVDEVRPEWSSIPYGKPLRGARYYILDKRMQPRPIGVPGDLYIAGDCLALGYAAAPALTAERFIPDPFDPRPGRRMYCTGDLAKFQADGTMIFLGRSDFQVKIRGYRIETGEIEHVLAKHPAVAAVAVVAREDVPGDKRLVAYVVPQQAATSELIAELRNEAARHLPEYMVPAAFVRLDALPLTSNGKLDRRALPAPEHAMETCKRVAPRNALEAEIAGLWARVLGHDGFGVTDNFFDVGGHSLSAFQIVSQARDSYGVELPLRVLFEAPTVEALAQNIQRAQTRAPSPQIELRAPLDAPSHDLSELLAQIENFPENGISNEGP